jgi:hypothetical protein
LRDKEAYLKLYAALPTLHGEWWYILDAATWHIQAKLTAGAAHNISVEPGLWLPYILVGPNAEPLLSFSRVSKKFAL